MQGRRDPRKPRLRARPAASSTGKRGGTRRPYDGDSGGGFKPKRAAARRARCSGNAGFPGFAVAPRSPDCYARLTNRAAPRGNHEPPRPDTPAREGPTVKLRLPGGVLTRKLWRDLRGRKASTFVLVLLVMTGIGAMTSMQSLYRDLKTTRDTYYRDYRLAHFTVDMRRAPERAVALAAGAPNVAAAEGRVSLQVLIELPGRIEPVTGIAHSLPLVRRPVMNDIYLASGGWFTGRSDREVILNKVFAEANGLRPGNRLKVTLLDEQHDLLIVGTASSPEHIFLLPLDGGIAPDPARFGVMYLPEELLQRSGDLEGAYNQIVGMTHLTEERDIRETLDFLERSLDPWGVTNTTPMQDQPSVQLVQNELTELRSNALILPSIFLGVAMLILNVLLGRIVTQQRGVIGTLRAIGRSRAEILRHYLWIGISVAVLGGLAGMVLSLWLQGIIIRIYADYFTFPRLEAGVYPSFHLLGFAIALLAGCIGTARSALRAASLQPAEAMSPPPPEKGGRIVLERFTVLWSRLSFRRRLVMRAIFRNPFRSTVGFLTAMISMALMVATFALADGINYLVEFQFNMISHEDLRVALREPVGDPGAREISDLPTITTVEPQLAIVCDVSAGHRRERIGVVGIPVENRLFTPLDLSGRPIIIPHGGLVLTDKAANLLDVGVGDSLSLRPLIGRRERVEVPVLGIVRSYLGVSAYAEIGYLSGLIGEDRVANAILATSDSNGAWAPLYAEIKDRKDIVGMANRERSIRQMRETFIRNLKVSITVLILFAGLIAFGSVLNTALVSLSEREREVGTFRVLGYSPREVAAILRGEQIILFTLGTLAGVLAGIALTHALAVAYDTDFLRLPVVIYPSRILIAAALMGGFISLAQVLVYGYIRNLPWLDVMKTKE